jgi:hypothetical protein
LARYKMGKPILIEETFPLKCSPMELGTFLQRSRGIANGWIGFYWGTPPEELKGASDARSRLMLGWLDLFQELNPNR